MRPQQAETAPPEERDPMSFYFPMAGAFGPWERPTDRYQMTVYPGGRVTLDAVTDRGRVFTVHGIGDSPAWTQSQCRAYAAEAGFNVEAATVRDGLTVVTWTEPEETAGQAAALRTHNDGARAALNLAAAARQASAAAHAYARERFGNDPDADQDDDQADE
jgi:hypothetical protein